MRKIMILLVIFALMASTVLAGTVTRNMPSRIQPGQTLTVTLSVSAAPGQLFTLEDVIPVGLSIKEWTVNGAQESKDQVSTRTKENRFGWSFTPTGSTASVEYKIDLPNTETSYTFGKVVWFDPSGQGIESSTPTLTVAVIRCGDGVCEGSENSDNCAQDCPKPAAPTPQPQVEPQATAQKAGLSSTAWIIIVVIVLVLVAIGFVVWQKKKSQQ
ncbi:MAG: hypothetical protein AABX32_00060 [Nanoarchaeota archaeon]